MRGPLPSGVQRVRRYRGQSVVVTCRQTGARATITLSAVRDAGPGSASLLIDDPDGRFDVQSAEGYIPIPRPAIEATGNAIRDAFQPARDK